MARPFMPFYVGDYLRDTQHLSAEQHGAYLLLLMACWTLGALPDDPRQLIRIAKIGAKKWSVIARLLDTFFVKNRDGSWHQQRVDKERDRLEKLREARSKAGSKGVAKREANRMQARSKNDARARVPEPDIDSDGSVGEEVKGGALQETSNLKTKPSECEISHARASGSAIEEEENLVEGELGGRCAPLARDARLSEPASMSVRVRRKELLRAKVMRFASDRFQGKERSAAIAGICGSDPEHDEQWWLDRLDVRMRAEHWQDRG